MKSDKMQRRRARLTPYEVKKHKQKQSKRTAKNHDSLASNHPIALETRVSLHCIQRYIERVLGGSEDTLDGRKVANDILSNLDFELKDGIYGTFEFLDEFTIIIKNGYAITIKERP